MTINGANLAGPNAVTFNGVAATSFTPVSATQLKATVPPGATTGKIAVTTIAGTALSLANFTIPLAITNINPTSGEVGDTVVITGTGFVFPLGVKFGDATAGGTIDSATQLTVTVPEGATDGPIVVGERHSLDAERSVVRRHRLADLGGRSGTAEDRRSGLAERQPEPTVVCERLTVRAFPKRRALGENRSGCAHATYGEARACPHTRLRRGLSPVRIRRPRATSLAAVVRPTGPRGSP